MDSIQKGQTKKRLHIFVFFVVMILGWILPPTGLPPEGMKIMGVFLALLYGWSFIGFAWPSMLCMIALGFSGYATPENVIAQAFTHPAVLFTIFVLVFTKYCDRSGLNDIMAKWLLSRRIFIGRPWVFLSFVFTGTLIIGFLIDGVPVVFLISGLLYTIFKDIGYKPGDDFPAYTLAGVCIAGVLSFACKPWMGQNLLWIGALAQISGGKAVIGNLTLIACTFPVCVAILLLYVLLIRYIFKPDTNHLLNLSDTYLTNLRNQICLNKNQVLAAIFLCIFLAFMFVPNIFPTGSEISAFFSKFNMVVAITLILGILSFITVDGKNVFDFQNCSDGINWNIVWMLAASIPISAALSGEDAGLGNVITNFFQNFSSDGSQLFFIFGFTLFASIMTQLTHNVTIVLVAEPIIWNLSRINDINPIGMSLMLFLSVGAAFATPAASTVGALSFANGEWIGVRRAFQAGIFGWLCAIISIFLIGTPVISVIVGI